MSSSTAPTGQNGFKKPMSLGSKSRSFIPMTPRNLKTNSENRNDFARQVADHTSRGQDGQPPQKRFRSSAAPKGTKLASGYVDRAQERLKEQDDDGEDKQKRLKALEEMLKLQQIDMPTFESLRDEIGVGGDTSTTHLVKGLDFKLLERIRRGDDLEKAPEEAEAQAVNDADIDVDEELEKALDQDTVRASKTQAEERDSENDTEMPVPDEASHGVPLTRNEILELMKQRRKNANISNPEASAASAPLEAGIDHSRFRKLESKAKPNKHKFTESINGRRREVLIITDKKGNTKRKTRWLDPEHEPSTTKNGIDKNQAWGNDLPTEVLARMKAAEEQEATRQKAEADEEDDGDIFGGVGDYDPLAAINSDDDQAETPRDDTAVKSDGNIEKDDNKDNEAKIDTKSKPLQSTSKPRNYFATSTNADSEPPTAEADSASKTPSHDPAILAALKRAAQIRQQEESEGRTDTTGASNDATNTTAKQSTEEQARSKALLQKLQKQSGYDDMDIDMGFGGGSRYDDEDEDGEGRQKLSQWTGVRKDGEDEDEDGGDEKKGGGAKRKRGGGKKKKGDKNSFTDVMSVIEGRKKG